MALLKGIRKDTTLTAALALWGVYFLILLLTSYRTHFAILANDAIPLLFQAENLSWSDMRSFYNGFFPIGYPATLRLLLIFGREHIDALGVVLNLILAFAMIWGLLKAYTLKLSIYWAVLAVTVTLFLPEMLRGALSLRPDLIVAVLASVALMAYQRERYALAGAMLGIACLYRTHALALFVAFVIACLLFRNWRHCLKMMLWATPFLILQGVLNLAAGETFFASAQGYNIAKMIQGTGWRDDTVIVPSVVEVISDHPIEVFNAYIHHLLKEWYYLIPLIAGLFVVRSREIALIALLYLLAVGLGASPRGSLPVQAYVAMTLAFIIAPRIPEPRKRGARLVPVVLSVAIVFFSSLLLMRSAENARDRIERYRTLGEGVGLRRPDDAKQVLTDDFALYFPQIENAAPYVNGGWGPIGIPTYRERVPQFMQSDPAALRDSLMKNHVQLIVLKQPSTDTRLELAVKDSSNFVRQADVSGYAVYKVR
ncbi:MAG TPA: glycosyltransferase family 87 protein [Candidatus Kapabacteria bacterium]|nr:glycosyltransferase family 87 protein [Candidatus Kapabacteria bacterium]